ncbi:MAG: glycosyltransferase family 4 protein [Nitrososphaeria archaeon]
MTMVVTHICGKYRPAVDGLSNYVYNLTIRLKNNYKVFVITTDLIKQVNIIKALTSSEFDELLSDNLNVIRLRTKPPYLPYIWSYGITLQLIKQKNLLAMSDIVHVHSYMQWHSDTSVFLSRYLNKPSVLTIHAYGYYKGKASRALTKVYHYSVARSVLSRPDFIVVLDPIAYKFFSKIVPENKVKIVPNGIDYNRFNIILHHAIRDRIKFLLGLKEYVVLYVGQLIKRKGLETSVRAFNRLVKKGYTNISLLIVGDGSEYDELLNLISSLHLTESIKILRKVDDRLLPYIYKVADLFVLPSYYEGLPTVILEAFASGLPVIATKVGGIPWLIKSSKAGILIEPGDHITLAEAIEKILFDNTIRKRMSINAAMYAKKFDWSVIVHMIENLYKEVVV